MGRYSIRKPETGQLLVVSSTKSKLEEINNVSRQLLSQLSYIEEYQKNIPNELQQNPPTSQPGSSKEDDIANKALTDLMYERHKLITSLFENNSSKEIYANLILVNEMIEINSELTSKSQACKKSIAGQTLKVKNSTKVTRFYQKY